MYSRLKDKLRFVANYSSFTLAYTVYFNNHCQNTFKLLSTTKTGCEQRDIFPAVCAKNGNILRMPTRSGRQPRTVATSLFFDMSRAKPSLGLITHGADCLHTGSAPPDTRMAEDIAVVISSVVRIGFPGNGQLLEGFRSAWKLRYPTGAYSGFSSSGSRCCEDIH